MYELGFKCPHAEGLITNLPTYNIRDTKVFIAWCMDTNEFALYNYLKLFYLFYPI